MFKEREEECVYVCLRTWLHLDGPDGDEERDEGKWMRVIFL